MKPTVLFLALGIAISTSAVAQSDNNKATSSTMTQALLDKVILRDVHAAETAIKHLQTSLSTEHKTRTADIDTAFSQLVSAWKAVQSAYVLGELDSDMIDTPQLIDTYHQGKENLNTKLAHALKSGDEPRVALFKNTFKSINALAIFLYTDKSLSATERVYAAHTLNTLEKHFANIAQSYKTHADRFNAYQDESTSYVLNALIDSAYKLKEWRVGDAAGLSKKYEGEVDSRRQEYPLSQQSLNAMQAILSVHDDIMGQRDYENLGSAASKAGAIQAVGTIRTLIHNAQQQLAVLQNANIHDFTDPRFKVLFSTLNQLSDAYYQSLVQALPVQAKILDADGD